MAIIITFFHSKIDPMIGIHLMGESNNRWSMAKAVMTFPWLLSFKTMLILLLVTLICIQGSIWLILLHIPGVILQSYFQSHGTHTRPPDTAPHKHCHTPSHYSRENYSHFLQHCYPRVPYSHHIFIPVLLSSKIKI